MSNEMRTFKTPKGTELPFLLLKGKPYLAVQHRIVWFREEKSDWTITTEFIELTNSHATAKATIKDPQGNVRATAHKYEDKQGFADFREKAESSSVGRALAFLGYGTAFALELEEGERLADSPTEDKKKVKDLPPGAHTDPIGVNEDSYHYLITAGKLDGHLLGEVDLEVLESTLREAKTWLKTNVSHTLYQKVLEFSQHAENFLEIAIDEDAPRVIEPKGPKASAGLVGKLIKAYQNKGIDAHKLNEALSSEFNESFPNLTEATAKTMLSRLD